MKKVLAIDMGATSIRGVIGYIKNDTIITEEVMRMTHDMVEKNGYLYWQYEKLMNKIVETVKKYSNEIASVGINTWGVDFGLIDKEGNLVDIPRAYRDAKNEKGYKKALDIMSKKEIFLNTGTQIMQINSLFQLMTIKEEMNEVYEKADKLLMLPNLFSYMLCSNISNEETEFSTSEFMDLNTKDISENMIDKMGIKRELFPEIVKPGTKLGNTKNSKIEQLRDLDVDVIAACGHDTASAVMMTRAFLNDDTMFLSCGTWSLFGVVTGEAVINEEVYKKDLTNEIGYGSKSMLFKNITGLYLLEKYKEQLEKAQGRKIDFDEITRYVKENTSKTKIIDMDYEEFSRDDVDAKLAIDRYLEKTKQDMPKEALEYFKIIYDSLVYKYAQVKKSIEEVTQRKYKKIHMIGGGAKSDLLCRLVADKLDSIVISGPYEATSIGNILLQLYANGKIESVEKGMHMVYEDIKPKFYYPEA